MLKNIYKMSPIHRLGKKLNLPIYGWALVICGAMSHMCIDATTRAAFDLGFNCIVIEDACATRDLQHKGAKIEAGQVHGAFMAALSGLYAKVISVDEYIDLIASESKKRHRK
jgi:isochorismate hydrolase